MPVLVTPPIIPQAWAANGTKDSIPNTTSEFGRASWDKGFPDETARPLGQNGTPPRYKDIQGVLYALSEHAIYQQAGTVYPWSAQLDYLRGSHVLGSDGKEYFSLKPSGTASTGKTQNPTLDSNHEYWQLWSEVIRDAVLQYTESLTVSEDYEALFNATLA